MTRRILFVGDNSSLRAEFQLPFSAADCTWTAEFARTGAEAVGWVARSEFDAVFADARLPQLSGLEVLDQIALRQPKALRIIQTEITDTANTLQCIGRAHHHVVGPCTGATITKLLHQALTMESWLPSEALQGLLGQMRHIPSPPSLYFQIADELKSSEASIETIGNLISQDPALTAKLLQLANSAMFGLQLTVSNPMEAVGYIGLETTQALVLLSHSFAGFDQKQLGDFSIESLWQHSVWTGHFARRIALAEKCDPDSVAQAFVAGLLHDIGKLLFAANLPKAFASALELASLQNRPLWEVEAQVFGANHAEIGGCLLGIWGLPAPIVDAVAYHHFPIRLLTQPFSPLTATFAANIFEHSARHGESMTGDPELDPDYLKSVGLGERVEDWRESCLVEP
jgi:HD-like signal output (HDOD) protein/CheY-like chemotaxis protein